MCKIKEVFARKFERYRICIDETDVFIGNKKKIPQGEWTISFIIEEDSRGVFLEYYGMNSRNIHMHGRIYNDGQEQVLDVLQGYIAYRPNVPGDRERGTKEFESYNTKVIRRLREKQLL